jgi:thiol-disulfide isomerase/thioredoxin
MPGRAAPPRHDRCSGSRHAILGEPLRSRRPLRRTETPAEGLRGKVVLVDFWEYTCINWIRTAPFVSAWHARYADLGLVVVGVHTPEFEFGKLPENVDRGIRDHRVTYPIAIDNDHGTWAAFHNDAWPTKYLFDAKGRLRGVHVGEGAYPAIETAIRALLTEAGARSLPPMTAEVMAYARQGEVAYGRQSPETYLGAGRRHGNGGVALVGDWKTEREYVEHKADVGADSIARFDRSGMVRLVRGAGPGAHRLELETTANGLRAYSFTFGP